MDDLLGLLLDFFADIGSRSPIGKAFTVFLGGLVAAVGFFLLACTCSICNSCIGVGGGLENFFIAAIEFALIGGAIIGIVYGIVSAAQERQRAEQERQRAEQEKQRAEQEVKRQAVVVRKNADEIIKKANSVIKNSNSLLITNSLPLITKPAESAIEAAENAMQELKEPNSIYKAQDLIKKAQVFLDNAEEEIRFQKENENKLKIEAETARKTANEVKKQASVLAVRSNSTTVSQQIEFAINEAQRALSSQNPYDVCEFARIAENAIKIAEQEIKYQEADAQFPLRLDNLKEAMASRDSKLISEAVLAFDEAANMYGYIKDMWQLAFMHTTHPQVFPGADLKTALYWLERIVNDPRNASIAKDEYSQAKHELGVMYCAPGC